MAKKKEEERGWLSYLCEGIGVGVLFLGVVAFFILILRLSSPSHSEPTQIAKIDYGLCEYSNPSLSVKVDCDVVRRMLDLERKYADFNKYADDKIASINNDCYHNVMKNLRETLPYYSEARGASEDDLIFIGRMACGIKPEEEIK